MSIEREYAAVDFSRFSKVKESLRTKLHQARRDAAPSRLGRVKLDMEDLDYVAAAGTGTPPASRYPLDQDKN